MKFAAVFLVALIVSALAAHLLVGDQGWVIINFRGYLIEMSVPGFLIIAAAVVFVIWLIRRVIQAPRRLGEAAGRYRSGRAGQRLTRGMIEVAEGNFAKGEKLLARAATTSDSPLFNYLQLQLDRQQHEQALATLRRIEENSRNHSHALALLGRLYYRLQDWDHLAALLPRLTKQGRVEKETLNKWAVRVHSENFSRAADGDAVITEWKTVPKALKNDTNLLDAYYMNLLRTGLHEKAEKDLAAALKSEWRGSLVRVYGLVEGLNASKQLKRAEGWLSKHGDDPDLLLAAARLCLRNELWGKARSYLETVISLRPTPEAYQEYGRLLNQLGEGDAAADAYRQGLGMVAHSPSLDIPRLESDQR
jgi:HemY protein